MITNYPTMNMKITVYCNVCNEDRGVRHTESGIRNFTVNLKKMACRFVIYICFCISAYKWTQDGIKLSTSHH
jgi:hypothetical protein